MSYVDGGRCMNEIMKCLSMQFNSDTVEISLTPIENNGSIYVALLDGTANHTITSTYSSDSIASITGENLEPGLYYVRISAGGNNYGCYSLILE